jgi:hypothetical protein
MKHNIIAFGPVSRIISIGSVSLLLLLLHLLASSQLAVQGGTISNDDSNIVLTGAYAQLADSTLNGTSAVQFQIENNNTGTLPPDANSSSATQTYENITLRGEIGSTVVNGTSDNQTTEAVGDGYVITGRWRVVANQTLLDMITGPWEVVANQTLLDRFFANLTIAPTNGIEPHKYIIIEDTGPSFALTKSGNNASMSNINVTIYRNNNNNTTNVTAPAHLEIRGNNNVLQLVVNMENKPLPPELLILHLLDEKPVYGTVQEIGVEKLFDMDKILYSYSSST